MAEPINTPYSQRNNYTGGVVADEILADARTVTVKLHHGPDYPSVLESPLAACSFRGFGPCSNAVAVAVSRS